MCDGIRGPRRVARIVEVEAYSGTDDRASHARFGRTDRTAVMFGPPGVAYVYLVYGMYHCLNVVTEPDGSPAAVLIRAAEPLEGSVHLRAARTAAAAARGRAPVTGPEALLCSGPGRVGDAFGLSRGDTGRDLCDPAASLRLEVAPPGARPVRLEATPRIGIAYAGEPWTSRPWRLFDGGSPAVSGRRSASGDPLP